MEVPLNDDSLSFANFGGAEILKHCLTQLILVPLRERIFRIHFNF
jgi:hypothetical protein